MTYVCCSRIWQHTQQIWVQQPDLWVCYLLESAGKLCWSWLGTLTCLRFLLGLLFLAVLHMVPHTCSHDQGSRVRPIIETCKAFGRCGIYSQVSFILLVRAICMVSPDSRVEKVEPFFLKELRCHITIGLYKEMGRKAGPLLSSFYLNSKLSQHHLWIGYPCLVNM